MSAQPLPNTNYYLDQMMSIEMIKNLCSGKGKSEIAKFILIIGMDEFKRLFKVIIDKFIQWFQTLEWTNILPSVLIYLWTTFKNILLFPLQIFRSRPTTELDIFSIEKLSIETSLYKTVLKTSAKLQHSFWEQITSENFQDIFSYRLKEISSFDQKDNITIHSSETWTDLRLNLPQQNLMIEFEEEVEVKFTTRYNKKTIISLNGSSIKTSIFEEWKPFCKEDFTIHENGIEICKITFDRLIPCKQVAEKLEEIYKKIEVFMAEQTFQSNTNLFNVNYYPYINCPSFSLKNEPNVNKYRFDLETKKELRYWNRLSLLLAIFAIECCDKENGQPKTSLKKDLTKIYHDTKSTSGYVNMMLGLPCVCSSTTSYMFPSTSAYNLYCIIGEKIKASEFFQNEMNWKLLVNHICALCAIEPIYKDITTSSVPSKASGFMNIRVLSNEHSSQEELQKAFFNYLNTFSSNTPITTDRSKVKTFDIKIEYKEKKVTIPNPVYTLQQKRLEDLKNALKSEITDKMISEMISTMPPETIEEVQRSKEVVCTPINEVYKDLSRLYLSKKDKQKLSAMLQDFRDDKELMTDLGLPNKLAVLLYGEPGCGKSSTIETIGSYLQKDIYNLNLQSVQTNEDLARLWDYVTNQTKNGGCIVLEDVDAQSDIVLARTLQSTNNHIPIVTPNETPLSLSFFLNLIQGSSQRDGQVFVTTTNWIEKLDPAFTRSMRFDVKIEMRPADHDQITEIYSIYFPRRKMPLERIKQIPEYKYTPAMFIDCFRQYIKNPDFTDEELFADFL
jgi:ATPase family associated with various cellular activities (AAA)